MSEKIKVVWLCHFSNAFVHERLKLGYSWPMRSLRKAANKPFDTKVSEFAVWITNGIREFEKLDEVELHIVSPYPHLSTCIQEFSANGIYYHFFHNEEEDLLNYVYKRIFCPKHLHYRKNRQHISKIINKIQPDIVHLIGAENPYYSMGILDVPKNTITIAQLQTLLEDPAFKANCSMEEKRYNYKSTLERSILERVDYIGTGSLKYINIIKVSIRPKASFLNIDLFLKEPIIREQGSKQFDFVYFAANINKAADLAIEAFARVYQQDSNITLDIIGGYDSDYKQYMDDIIHQFRIENAVTFEGRLPSHDDVIVQIRKSRFALLPLRIDLTSSTIREAMSNGLPVITTDTGELGTQGLNKKRQNVLISPIGDHQALAENMMLLLNNEVLADTLRQNAYQTRNEAKSNEETAQMYVKAYKSCLENFLKAK